MRLFEWINGKIKKMTWVDIAFIELCVAAFALLIAKVVPAVLKLDWYWYALVGGLAYVRCLAALFRR